MTVIKSFFSAMPSSLLLQEISVVKGSGKVEQAKNIKARKLENRKNRSESSRDNLKRQESNFAETKKGRADGQFNEALRGFW